MSSENDLSRRGAASLILAALGGVGLGACSPTGDGDTTDQTGTQTERLSGVNIAWVDTVLGAAPPAVRTGDLATKTGPTLGATMVMAKGCVTIGDGGGGLFFWDSGAGTDNGGTVIVPGGAVGTTGACWRRVG